MSYHSFLGGWPVGVVTPYTYYCLVTRVTHQWEFDSKAGNRRAQWSSEDQQFHPYLLFYVNGRAFLCFLPQVPHQHISILPNDREHLDTQHNSTGS